MLADTRNLPRFGVRPQLLETSGAELQQREGKKARANENKRSRLGSGGDGSGIVQAVGAAVFLIRGEVDGVAAVGVQVWRELRGVEHTFRRR